MMRWLLIMMFTLMGASWSSSAQACSCLQPDVTRDWNNSDYQLTVRVMTEIVTPTQRYYRARVRRNYKGCVTAGTEIVLRTPASGAQCGTVLSTNTDYVISGYEGGTHQGRPIVDIGSCGFNVLVSDVSAAEWDFLDSRTVCCGAGCECADGGPMVSCFIDPCQTSPGCAGGVECQSNYCGGGCDAEWYGTSGELVCENP